MTQTQILLTVILALSIAFLWAIAEVVSSHRKISKFNTTMSVVYNFRNKFLEGDSASKFAEGRLRLAAETCLTAEQEFQSLEAGNVASLTPIELKQGLSKILELRKFRFDQAVEIFNSLYRTAYEFSKSLALDLNLIPGVLSLPTHGWRKYLPKDAEAPSVPEVDA